jgi:hypothetical protein
MSIVEQLRKGFGYMLMCMGVSSPAARQKPPASQPPQPGSNPPAPGVRPGK